METCTGQACTDPHADLLLGLIRQEAQVALGCTEPAMVALAAARAKGLAWEEPVAITVVASPGVMKNAQAVGLPGTSRKGLGLAAALGALGGDAGLGLEVFRSVSTDQARAAWELVRDGRVSVRCADGQPGLYVRVEVTTARHKAAVTIEGSHTNVTGLELDGSPVTTIREAAGGGATCRAPGGPGRVGGPARARTPVESLAGLTFEQVFRAVLAVDLDQAAYLLDGAERNLEVAARAVRGEGDQAAPELVGAMRRVFGGPAGTCAAPATDDSARPAAPAAGTVDAGPAPRGTFALSPDLVLKARLWTAAAVSARMGGTMWPVLTSGGSGNQGILVSVPLLLVAEAMGLRGEVPGGGPAGDGVADRSGDAGGGGPGDRPSGNGLLVRALVLAHAVNLYLKAFTGELSALCGSVTAGAAVAAAVCWLAGGDRGQVERAIELVVSGSYPALCDGAKGSCAVKMAAGAAEGVVAGYLARAGALVPRGEGLTGRTFDETVRFVGRLNREVLGGADRLLLRETSQS